MPYLCPDFLNLTFTATNWYFVGIIGVPRIITLFY